MGVNESFIWVNESYGSSLSPLILKGAKRKLNELDWRPAQRQRSDGFCEYSFHGVTRITGLCPPPCGKAV
jgi:hypothetical protein